MESLRDRRAALGIPLSNPDLEIPNVYDLVQPILHGAVDNIVLPVANTAIRLTEAAPRTQPARFHWRRQNRATPVKPKPLRYVLGRPVDSTRPCRHHMHATIAAKPDGVLLSFACMLGSTFLPDAEARFSVIDTEATSAPWNAALLSTLW